MRLSRRLFLQNSLGTAAAAALNQVPEAASVAFAAEHASQTHADGPHKSPDGRCWFKGNTHMHSQWSDGQAMPEIAVKWYRDHGYDFICLTDHNLMQSEKLRFDSYSFKDSLGDSPDRNRFDGETSFWKPIEKKPGWAKLTQAKVDEAREAFGPESVRTREAAGRTFVRMKTMKELKKQFETPDEFLMIQGWEVTAVHGTWSYHTNFLNVEDVFPDLNPTETLDLGATAQEAIRYAYSKGKELYENQGKPYVFTVNHPEWRYYDIGPKDLIALPEVRFFELINNGTNDAHYRRCQPHPQGWTPEKFWDVVNAYRAEHGQPLLLGLGSDDRHDYDGPSKGWTVVRSEHLTVESLFAALNSGDFYASNGLDFDEIEFRDGTLRVHVLPEPGACASDYRILFFGTKRGCDLTPQMVSTANNPEMLPREIEVYSDEIGRQLAAVDGLEGSYTLQEEDLYVRAKVVRVDRPADAVWKTVPEAWTQPYAKNPN